MLPQSIKPTPMSGEVWWGQVPSLGKATGDFRAVTECHCGPTKVSESPFAKVGRRVVVKKKRIFLFPFYKKEIPSSGGLGRGKII